jgi:hypothetical protein
VLVSAAIREAAVMFSPSSCNASSWAAIAACSDCIPNTFLSKDALSLVLDRWLVVRPLNSLAKSVFFL